MSKRRLVMKAFIPNLFPSINDVLRVRSQNKRHGWSNMKRDCQNAVAKVMGTCKMLPKVPYSVVFKWQEWNTRRDPDNIASGGCKPILDALIKIGIIEDDGWDYFGELIHRFTVAEKKEDVGVWVYFYRDEELIRERRKTIKNSRGSHPPRNCRIVKPKKRRKKRRKRGKNRKMGFKKKSK